MTNSKNFVNIIFLLLLLFFSNILYAQTFENFEEQRSRRIREEVGKEQQLVGKTVWFYYDNNKCYSSSFPTIVDAPWAKNPREFKSNLVTKIDIVRLVKDKNETRYFEVRIADDLPLAYMRTSSAYMIKENEKTLDHQCASLMSPDDIAEEIKQSEQRMADERAAAKAAKDKKDEDFKKWLNESTKRDEQTRAAALNRAKLPGVRIGMTASEVTSKTNWGKPRNINRTTTTSGTTEQWVYDGGNYLYFTNGVLTAIQN